MDEEHRSAASFQEALDLLAVEHKLPSARVDLGRVTATPGAVHIPASRVLYCLAHHRAGIWGIVPLEDVGVNERALARGEGLRLMSAWAIDVDKPSTGHGDNTLWIMTQGEDEERYTTLLLPDEY